MDIKSAQKECRDCYVGGGPGVVISGLVWLTAALVLSRAGTTPAFATLFFGGMLISPLNSLAVKFLFRRTAPSKENALVALGLETVIALIACLLAAWLLLGPSPQFVFPVAALAIGTRYFSFSTLYGDKLFWVIGGLITAIGAAGIWGSTPIPGGVPLAIGVTEIVFGLLLTVKSRPAS